MANQVSAGADISLAVMLIIVALVTIYGTLELPPGSFEPLGSATIPQFVAGGIIAFSIWIIALALKRRHAPEPGESSGPAARAYRSRHDLALGLMVLAVAYVAVMAMDWVRFSVATLSFLLVAVGMLTGFRWRAIPVIAALAASGGFGLEYLFTQVFVIDLP